MAWGSDGLVCFTSNGSKVVGWSEKFGGNVSRRLILSRRWTKVLVMYVVEALVRMITCLSWHWEISFE